MMALKNQPIQKEQERNPGSIAYFEM